MNFLSEKKLIAFTLFFSILTSASHAETIQEQYDDIQDKTIRSLDILNHNFFDKLENNILCSSSEPILLGEDDEKIHIKVNYKCVLNSFDVLPLEGYTAESYKELIDIQENSVAGMNKKIIDEYFNKIKKNFIIKVGLNGVNNVKTMPFFHSNYTENSKNVVFHAESVDDSAEFEIQKSQIGLIKSSYALLLWTSGKPSEMLNNLGYLENKEVLKIIAKHIKSDRESLVTDYMCAQLEEVKTMRDFLSCTVNTRLKSMMMMFGSTKNYGDPTYSLGKKTIFPLNKAVLKAKFKSHVDCLAKLTDRRFKSEKELDNTVKQECQFNGTDILILPKKIK